MRKIFVSYRRDDSEGEAGRLFDDLVSHFGDNSVFMDVAAIEPGRDFRRAIDESVATCAVLLAIIGRNWLDAKNETGQRRLDDASDFVRLETASALKRDIPVIPVLVHGAKMPHAEQLPDDLKELVYRNGVELSHTRWGSDLQLLLKALRHYVDDPKTAADQPSEGARGERAVGPAPTPARESTQAIRSPVLSPALWWKSRGALLALALSAAGAVAVLIYLHSPREATVPDLTGTTLSEAVTKLEAAHLAVGSKTHQRVAEKKPNIVLSQSPAPSARVKSGTAVDLVLSQQLAMVEIPRVEGKLLNAAVQALLDEHLAVGNVSKEAKSGVAPQTVLNQFPRPGKKVDTGTPIDLVVSEAPVTPPHAPGAQAPQNLLPRFAGTWELIENIYQGEARQIKTPQRITITQDGDLVTIGNRQLKITNAGTVTYKNFAAPDGKSGHPVKTEDQADLVDTLTWRVEGDTLVFETTFNYKRPYFGHVPGTELRIMKYRRVTS